MLKDTATTNFTPSTYTDENRPWHPYENKHSQFVFLFGPYGTFFNLVSQNNPANEWPCKIRSRRSTRSSILDQDFGHLCHGWRIQLYVLRYEASSILIWILANTASAACPAHSGSFVMTSITFAAVTSDADEPCSVITLREPESSFAMSPRCTTRPLYFWKFGSNSEFRDDRCPSA